MVDFILCVINEQSEGSNCFFPNVFLKEYRSPAGVSNLYQPAGMDLWLFQHMTNL